MTGKLRVLVFSGCYLPGFRAGGPIRSLVNLVKALESDIDFRIVTLDTDVGSAEPYANVRSGEWQAVDGVEVLYLSRAAASMRRLAREIRTTSPQVIYLNGFFEPIFTLRVLLARRMGMIGGVPVLLAPRGDCSPGALAQKPLKKAVFIRLARLVNLHNELTWQASSELEARDIRVMMPHLRDDSVRVAPVLTEACAWTPPSRREPGALRVCFLARISPMKNLDFALRVLAEVKAPIDFTIHGPIEDPSYWDECRSLIARLPQHIRASYAGEVPPASVRRVIAGHDLFFLPTRGESFGHVIHEALSAGVPVLTSDQTQWNDIETHGAGWSLPLNALSEFRQTLEDASVSLPLQRADVARRAMDYAMKRADRPASIRKTYDLFRGVAFP